MNEIISLKQIENQLKEINQKLIAEKRKTVKAKLSIQKRKLIKQYRNLKQLAISKMSNHELDVWLIDATALSVKPLKLKKKRYLKALKDYETLNLLIAYNFNKMLGYALMFKARYPQIRKDDLETLKTYLPNDALTCTDNRHKYTFNVNKALTMNIERLFAWIKKPIYKKINQVKTIEHLLNLYKTQLRIWNITPINF